MPYDVKITEYPEGEQLQKRIEELKELKELLEKFSEKTIEVEVKKVKWIDYELSWKNERVFKRAWYVF